MEIEINVDSLIGRIDGMIQNIDHFKRVDIGMAMSDWQSEDMHRHRPFTMRSRARGLATTTARQHSLYEMLRSEGAYLGAKELRGLRRSLNKRLRHRLPRSKKKVAWSPSIGRQHRHWSSRPILRRELIEQLRDREWEALQSKVTWAEAAGGALRGMYAGL